MDTMCFDQTHPTLVEISLPSQKSYMLSYQIVLSSSTTSNLLLTSKAKPTFLGFFLVKCRGWSVENK